jgi:hypothetical protein
MACFMDGRAWTICHAQLTILGHDDGVGGYEEIAW